ncbi:LADA_0C05556g1_1 [Lachancea dasiensis]|uniref:LADA_0C05556g1_1 n=1 Tax=Lachancea dasiensis TaxID=1072105 RepID=A0A1G4IZN7_9SACH|nr:LADA_0C05556g1_1 [Lachancea dasiensis]
MALTTKVLLLKNKTVPIDPYESAFEENGFCPVYVPLIQHMHLPEDCLKLLRDDKYITQLQYIVISSQRTVECINESILPRLAESQRKTLLKKTIYTVGPATADFLQRCGFEDIRGGIDAGNGSILADLIIADLGDVIAAEPTMLPVLLLVGETRRDIIPKKLASVKIPSQEIIMYKTEVLGDNLVRFQSHFTSNAWVVFFSSQGTVEIIDYLKTQSVHVASIGPTTEVFLASRGIDPQVVSTKPEPLSLISSLKSL